jgi:hypothetical protein
MYVQASNVPADAVLEATLTYAYIAQVTGIVGNSTTFSVGDTICVNQSVVGANILVPVQNAGDAAQVVLPALEGGACVPNYAYTVLLDDGGRPVTCNDGTQVNLPLTTAQAIAALQAPSCTSSLAAVNASWSETDCSTSGCHTAPTFQAAFGATATLLMTVVIARATRRRR